ncbi:MAG TPA: M48 family metalloprotease [Xanthomonadaceae bacterium]|nr:M48 family metalloprotease [Xanthomonadaceae bacterium]
MRRTTLIATALTIAIASFGAPAQYIPSEGGGLPDIGSSAGELLTPTEQAQYGQMLLSQLRHYGYTLEDPLLNGWLQHVGTRLGAASDEPRQAFTFFLLEDRQINAFATLGGYIGMNAGLVLAADEEDEVAGVLAHEIAHVTQDHVLRGVERAQKDSIPILLAMLGAVAAAQASNSSSSSEASQAAIASGMALMQQRQIDFTRTHESEADRLGIQTLDRAGYDPEAMAGFFQTLQEVVRVNQGGDERLRTPDYLQTHPVTLTRISEAKQRAERIRQQGEGFAAGTLPSANPLLPGGLQLPPGTLHPDSDVRFGWARERLRVLTADTPAAAIREYTRMREAGALDDARRYGLALAYLRDNQAAGAMALLEPLLAQHPGDHWLELAMGEAEARAGKAEAADRRFESLMRRMPRDPAVAITYAQVLAERNTAAAGRKAQEALRPIQASAGDDPSFQRTFARASEIAGEPVRAGEAWAEVAYLTGRAEQALLQLQTLKQREDLDYYSRARIDARIAQITPVVLELRRQGIHDDVLNR